MKKLLFIGLLLPLVLWAQNERTDLSTYGIGATIGTHSELQIEKMEQRESDLKTTEVRIYLSNQERIDLIQLKKPLTIAVTRAQFGKMFSQKHKGIKLKALVRTANEFLIQRTYDSDGRSIYKFLILRVIKGKEYMIESTEVSDESTCRQMFDLAKTIR